MAGCEKHKLDEISAGYRDEIASEQIGFVAGVFSIILVLNFVNCISGGPIATTDGSEERHEEVRSLEEDKGEELFGNISKKKNQKKTRGIHQKNELSK